jgi:hypothetical protein
MIRQMLSMQTPGLTIAEELPVESLLADGGSTPSERRHVVEVVAPTERRYS